jgi:hypothetical protein
VEVPPLKSVATSAQDERPRRRCELAQGEVDSRCSASTPMPACSENPAYCATPFLQLRRAGRRDPATSAGMHEVE